MMNDLKKVFVNIDILQKEIEEDIINYKIRTRRNYSFKEASTRHRKWNYLIFSRDYKRYLIDQKINTMETPIISIDLNF